MTLFLVLPMAMIVYVSFWTQTTFKIESTLTLASRRTFLIFCDNALPMIGVKLTAVEAGGLALALNEAPFIAEIIRGNVLGVDRGQVVAGQALGMTPSVVTLRVVAPQAIRSMVPALGNEAVSALKNSSLASVVSVQELTLRSTQLASANFDFVSVFFASGLMYLVLTGAIAVIRSSWKSCSISTCRRRRRVSPAFCLGGADGSRQ